MDCDFHMLGGLIGIVKCWILECYFSMLVVDPDFYTLGAGIVIFILWGGS